MNMNNITKNQACKVPIGTIIVGKWHKNKYKVVQPLGHGATGVVYLAESKNGLVALKISENNTSIISEVNVLKHFAKVQGSVLGPSLLDVDDWLATNGSRPTPFYVMEYVKGENLLSFIQKRGEEWIGILCVQLLADLAKLHHEGWVFGDLKPDNLLVVGPPPKIRWLDVGGTTLIGRSIKEFTEFYDRGYWGVGSRKAEPSYDLFAVAMIIINASFPKRFQKNGDGREQLKNIIHTTPSLKKYSVVLFNAIDGKYSTSQQMREDLLLAISQSSQTEPIRKKGSPNSNKNVSRQHYQKNRKKSRKGGVIETLLIIAFIMLAYFLYIYGQLL